MSGATTSDRLLGGRLLLEQPASGHRAGTDAALLATAVPRSAEGLVYDLGAGVGAVGLSIALRVPACRVVLVEIDAGMARLAGHSVGANGLSGRVEVVEADLTQADARFPRHEARFVVMNPPFYAEGSVRTPPDGAKRRAHLQLEGADDAWLRRAVSLLKPGGTLALIHRPEALPRLLAGLSGRFGDIRVKAVQPRAGHAASRLLIRATAGSRAPLRLLPPLVLHDDTNRFTPEADALHRGESDLEWDTTVREAPPERSFP